MTTTASIEDRRPRGLGFFERYLTIYVALPLVAGFFSRRWLRLPYQDAAPLGNGRGIEPL